MEWLQHFAAGLFAFLDNTVVKFVLLTVGTFLARKWPKFVNEAAPFWGLVSSIVLTVLHAIVPQASVETTLGTMGSGHMVMTGIFSSGSPLVAFFREALLPWLLSYGTQRAGDHTIDWAKGKKPAEVREEKKESPPIALKPFQTIIPEK